MAHSGAFLCLIPVLIHVYCRHIQNDKSCGIQKDDGEVISICRSLYFVAGDTTIGIIRVERTFFGIFSPKFHFGNLKFVDWFGVDILQELSVDSALNYLSA
ncbi:hypothetical protein DPMN_165352 [Dreissena polymorpha]|uniref:Uncharacterized protein n=1 Tax=Dreissena polymorpha TaxID=45954 RepID=A0A9D4F0F9_DREPO|nr:hypothetical protein DPMN_165352 [Dreissena polymorpha]